MNKILSLVIVCFCCVIAGCGGLGSSDVANATLENPLQVPLTGEEPSVYVQTSNKTVAKVDLDGLLYALLQSEYDMQIANSSAEADYVISLTIENFGYAGVEEVSGSTADVALPALVGAASGAQIGASVDGGEGALIGAGVGAAVGIGIGLLTSGSTHQVWQMHVDVQIKDNQKEIFTSRVNAKAQGDMMDEEEAAEALEQEVAWSIVKSFRNYN